MPSDETAQPPRDRARRIVCAEVNARRVNEALERGRPRQGVETFICECGAIGCTVKLQVGLDAYLAARRHFERFLVAPGHDVETIDTVVERCDGFWIVEKAHGAMELAQSRGARDGDG